MPKWFFWAGRQFGSVLLVVIAALLAGLGAIPAVMFYDVTAAFIAAPFVYAMLPVAYLVWGFSFCAVLIVLKRVSWLCGIRIKPGRYSLLSFTGGFWAFFSFLSRIAQVSFVQFLAGTPLVCIYFRGLGAKIGKDVGINTVNICDWELLEVGDGCVIGAGATVIGHVVEGNTLVLGKVKLEDRCTVGLNTFVMPGVTMQSRSTAGAYSLVPKDSTLVSGGVYTGLPVELVKMKGERASSSSPETNEAEVETPAPLQAA